MPMIPIMRILPDGGPVHRGIAATLPASLLAFLVMAIADLPLWLSESSPPPSQNVGLTFDYPFKCFLLLVWLLPVCSLVQYGMTRYRMRGAGTALRGVGLAAGPVMLEMIPMGTGHPTTADWVRRVPVLSAAFIFIAVWFALFNHIESRWHRSPGQLSVPRRGTGVRRSGAAMLTIAMFWALGCALVASLFAGVRGDGQWQLRGQFPSPRGDWRAASVVYDSNIGALSGMLSQVYVFPANRVWSQQNRGLLVWQSWSGVVDTVLWRSEHQLRVHEVKSWNDARAYPRGGFRVETESILDSVGMGLRPPARPTPVDR